MLIFLAVDCVDDVFNDIVLPFNVVRTVVLSSGSASPTSTPYSQNPNLTHSVTCSDTLLLCREGYLSLILFAIYEGLIALLDNSSLQTLVMNSTPVPVGLDCALAFSYLWLYGLAMVAVLLYPIVLYVVLKLGFMDTKSVGSARYCLHLGGGNGYLLGGSTSTIPVSFRCCLGFVNAIIVVVLFML